MSGIGRPTVGTANHMPIESRREDAMRLRAARDGSNNLLRAQLRTGQHLLPYALAESLAATLFMEPGTVRAATNDPTINEGARA